LILRWEAADLRRLVATMPYHLNQDLPASVREHLPEHAQDIFRSAFNHAWDEYATRSDREAMAFRVAWAAVKRHYRKSGKSWIAIEP